MEIKNYPDYLIYPDGKIEKIKGHKQHIMKQSLRNGYCRIRLRNEHGRPTFSVHRLVAEHYIPNDNNYETVDHIDRNPLNNHVSNLRWADRRMQKLNQKLNVRNKSGFKNLHERDNGKYHYWAVEYPMFKIKKTFKTKKEALCYKYICQLRIKAGHFTAEPPLLRI